MKNEKLFNMVEDILKNNIEARNNDKKLASLVWQRELIFNYQKPSLYDFFEMYEKNKLSNHDSITRYRRILKDKYPANPETTKHREDMQKEVKKDIKELGSDCNVNQEETVKVFEIPEDLQKLKDAADNFTLLDFLHKIFD